MFVLKTDNKHSYFVLISNYFRELVRLEFEIKLEPLFLYSPSAAPTPTATATVPLFVTLLGTNKVTSDRLS